MHKIKKNQSESSIAQWEYDRSNVITYDENVTLSSYEDNVRSRTEVYTSENNGSEGGRILSR